MKKNSKIIFTPMDFAGVGVTYKAITDEAGSTSFISIDFDKLRQEIADAANTIQKNPKRTKEKK